VPAEGEQHESRPEERDRDLTAGTSLMAAAAPGALAAGARVRLLHACRRSDRLQPVDALNETRD